MFGRTVRRRICNYKPWNLIDDDGAEIDIPKNTHQGELRFRDPRNPEDDILHLEDTTNSGYPWFFHGSIGISPQWVWMYPRFPEGKEIPGKFPKITVAKPTGGDKFSYVDGLKSPYDEPTDYVEYVIVPKLHLGAEYYNKDPDRAHRPRMNILFALYWFKPFTKEKNPTMIYKIAAREVPAAFFTVGFGDTPIDLGDTLKADWKVEPLSLDEALALRGGVR